MSDAIDDDGWIDSNTKALNANTPEVTPEERPTVPRSDEGSLAQFDSGRSLGYPLPNHGTASATSVQGAAFLHTGSPLFAYHWRSHSVSKTNTRPSPRGIRDSRQHRRAYTETHPAAGATKRSEPPKRVHTAVSDEQRDHAETTPNASSPVVSQRAETACEYR
jgi:hypothetical protein